MSEEALIRGRRTMLLDDRFHWERLFDISKEALQSKMDDLERQGYTTFMPVAWSPLAVIDGERKFGWSVTMFKEKK